ncbi:hypothetical protein KSP40_PGU017308 [Platanthera guangdongensis]|uniref:Uncharacterized protein n=1 Tax=Platanthera guangdongensis TaxID=2320717 RepID=A0ABR2MLF3_9ASPA
MEGWCEVYSWSVARWRHLAQSSLAWLGGHSQRPDKEIVQEVDDRTLQPWVLFVSTQTIRDPEGEYERAHTDKSFLQADFRLLPLPVPTNRQYFPPPDDFAGFRRPAFRQPISFFRRSASFAADFHSFSGTLATGGSDKDIKRGLFVDRTRGGFFFVFVDKIGFQAVLRREGRRQRGASCSSSTVFSCCATLSGE